MRTLDGFKKGVNLGGWLSQGPLDKEHLDTFITEKDIARIASWGLDHVRLPIDYDNFENEDGSDKEYGYAYIDSCIEWCRKYKLNMVLDLHKTYGYIFDDEAHLLEFFHEKPLQERFYGIWRKLIDRYAKDADIMMFEPLNEVVSPTVVNEWNEISSKCIEIIRAKAPTAKILLGGVGYNAVTSIKLLPHHNDENIVYNFHCYEPMVFTHQSAYWVTGMPSDFHIEYPGISMTTWRNPARSKGVCMGPSPRVALDLIPSDLICSKKCFSTASRLLKKETDLCTAANMVL